MEKKIESKSEFTEIEYQALEKYLKSQEFAFQSFKILRKELDEKSKVGYRVDITTHKIVLPLSSAGSKQPETYQLFIQATDIGFYFPSPIAEQRPGQKIEKTEVHEAVRKNRCTLY